jgi:hypothetical protein
MAKLNRITEKSIFQWKLKAVKPRATKLLSYKNNTGNTSIVYIGGYL